MILGIDYGKKRIGVAIADVSTKTAVPFSVLENKGLNDVLQKLKKIILEENIDQIVVGKPMTLKNEESEQTKEVIAFIEELKENLDILILEFDERFSSKQAGSLLRGFTKEKRDDVAAMVILQDYLEKSQAPNPKSQ